MKRVKLEIAYDGTNYCGWQVQPGQITVEQVINETLTQLLKEDIMVIGASRTDSGVHAKGNVAVFDTNSPMPAEKFCPALNHWLPEDIRIQSSVEVDADFHPRKVRSRKTYEYRILNRTYALPTERFYSTFIYYDLDVSAMQEAAKSLIGEHDFKSFCSVKTQAMSTVRTIYDIKVEKQKDIITITVCGEGFLYNMVRIIVGTLIKVGRGAYQVEKMEHILKSCDRGQAGPTAPPQGLMLVKIDYEDEKRAQRTRDNE